MNELGSPSTALGWTQRLTALALALQTIELLQLRRAWADDGIWRWELLAPEHHALFAPVRSLLRSLLPARRFALLLWARLLAALALGVGFGAAPFLFVTQVAIGVRFRGTFNGGSDVMSVILLAALSLPQLSGGSELAQEAALLYIAVQLTLSYFVAGVAKLQHGEWRAGGALRALVGSYGAPGWVVGALDGAGRLRWIGWSVLAFECAFPLAWSGPRACAILLGAGLCFHLAVWLILGLNRFVFVWVAAFPALCWCSRWVH